MSRYILEDLLHCPVGSRFIVCIAMDVDNIVHGDFYSDKANTIVNEIRIVNAGNCEFWKMYGQRYFVRQLLTCLVITLT